MVLAITIEHISSALKAVTSAVFLHQALEIQKFWMTNKNVQAPQQVN
jgi:hypothetical protein